MKIVCISRDDRPDRRQSILSQDWGWSVEIVDARKADTNSGVIKACCYTHLSVLKDHLPDRGNPLLILEDDAVLRDRERYLTLLSSLPESGCVSLGSIVHEKYDPSFSFTHAMLIAGLEEEQVENFGRAIERSKNAEHCYEKAFGTIGHVFPVIVDFLPFVSDRTKLTQKPILA